MHRDPPKQHPPHAEDVNVVDHVHGLVVVHPLVIGVDENRLEVEEVEGPGNVVNHVHGANHAHVVVVVG